LAGDRGEIGGCGQGRSLLQGATGGQASDRRLQSQRPEHAHGGGGGGANAISLLTSFISERTCAQSPIFQYSTRTLSHSLLDYAGRLLVEFLVF